MLLWELSEDQRRTTLRWKVVMMDVPGQHKKKAILPTNEDLEKINTNDDTVRRCSAESPDARLLDAVHKSVDVPEHAP